MNEEQYPRHIEHEASHANHSSDEGSYEEIDSLELENAKELEGGYFSHSEYGFFSVLYVDTEAQGAVILLENEAEPCSVALSDLFSASFEPDNNST